MAKFTGVLKAYHSKHDRSGNAYWGLEYIDLETGKQVVGLVHGGESNIYGILQHWGTPHGWDRSIMFESVEMGKKAFMDKTTAWPYAGCRSEDLADFIRAGLAETKGE